MPVTYVIEFHVKPAERERFLSLLGDVLSAMAHEANYRNAMLHVSPDDPLHFMLYETWASHDDVLNVQLQRPYRNAWHAALPELLEQPRGISIWRRFEGALATVRKEIARPKPGDSGGSDQPSTPYFLNQACAWLQASSAASLR